MGKYKVGLDRPDSMEGVAFEVPPVGLIENKGHVVVELDDEVAENLKNLYGVTIEESNEAVSVPLRYPGYNYPGVEAEVEVESEPGPAAIPALGPPVLEEEEGGEEE